MEEEMMMVEKEVEEEETTSVTLLTTNRQTRPRVIAPSGHIVFIYLSTKGHKNLPPGTEESTMVKQCRLIASIVLWSLNWTP